MSWARFYRSHAPFHPPLMAAIDRSNPRNGVVSDADPRASDLYECSDMTGRAASFKLKLQQLKLAVRSLLFAFDQFRGRPDRISLLHVDVRAKYRAKGSFVSIYTVVPCSIFAVECVCSLPEPAERTVYTVPVALHRPINC